VKSKETNKLSKHNTCQLVPIIRHGGKKGNGVVKAGYSGVEIFKEKRVLKEVVFGGVCKKRKKTPGWEK